MGNEKPLWNTSNIQADLKHWYLQAPSTDRGGIGSLVKRNCAQRWAPSGTSVDAQASRRLCPEQPNSAAQLITCVPRWSTWLMSLDHNTEQSACPNQSAHDTRSQCDWMQRHDRCSLCHSIFYLLRKYRTSSNFLGPQFLYYKMRKDEGGSFSALLFYDSKYLSETYFWQRIRLSK